MAMTKYFQSFEDVDQWDPAPNLTAQPRPLQARYLALLSGKPFNYPSMPSAGSTDYVFDQQCTSPEECQQHIHDAIDQHGECYVRMSGDPLRPRLTIWKAKP
jgi:hypothetical protein